MDRKLKAALKQSFSPPPAKRCASFTDSISCPRARFSQVFTAQIWYIRKRVWFLFVLGVCLAVCYTAYAHVPEHIIIGVSAILPFFSLCTITELYRSTAYNMAESELACRYNLPRITLMRLGILGTASIALLILFIVIAKKSDFGLLRNTVYIGVPYLISVYLSLLIISKFQSKETFYVCAAVNAGLSIFMIFTVRSFKYIYNADFTFIWVITFAMLAGLVLYSLNRFTQSQEELQWNLL